MINCLRCASYHADTDLLEPLMWGVRFAPTGGKGFNSSTDFDLKTLPPANQQIFTAFTLSPPPQTTIKDILIKNSLHTSLCDNNLMIFTVLEQTTIIPKRVACCHQTLKCGVRSPKFIWAPVYSCPHWLRPRNCPLWAHI